MKWYVVDIVSAESAILLARNVAFAASTVLALKQSLANLEGLSLAEYPEEITIYVYQKD